MTKTLAALLGFLFLQGVYSEKPINDECINATIIPSNAGVTSNYTTVPVQVQNVTKNPSDPITNCTAPSFEDPKGTDGVTLWYSWQPSVSGSYSFSTAGSTYNETFFDQNFDFELPTIIGVFKGTSCASIVQIECSIFARLRSVNLIAGEQYYIKIGLTPFDVGMVQLTVKPSPPVPANSKCLNAIEVDISSGEAVLTGDITSAEVDESQFSCFTGLKGLWYKVKNPSTMFPLVVTTSTCSAKTQFDTLITVFEGDDCESLSCLDIVDDRGTECALQEAYTGFISEQSSYYVLIQSTSDEFEGNFTVSFKSAKDYFTLVDSENDEAIDLLGDVVSYDNIGSKLNIQAVFSGDTSIGSVRVAFTNPDRSFCEEDFPYSVFWDRNGDYLDAVIPVGTHTVSATPYAANGCSGTAGTTLTKKFEVTGCSVQYYIIDTSDQSFSSILFPGQFFDNVLNSIPCDVSIYVEVFCALDIDAVKLELRDTDTNAIVVSKTETTAPYFLFGNDEEEAFAGKINPGSYSLGTTINGIEHESVFFTVLAVDDCVEE